MVHTILYDHRVGTSILSIWPYIVVSYTQCMDDEYSSSPSYQCGISVHSVLECTRVPVPVAFRWVQFGIGFNILEYVLEYVYRYR